MPLSFHSWDKYYLNNEDLRTGIRRYRPGGVMGPSEVSLGRCHGSELSWIQRKKNGLIAGCGTSQQGYISLGVHPHAISYISPPRPCLGEIRIGCLLLSCRASWLLLICRLSFFFLLLSVVSQESTCFRDGFQIITQNSLTRADHSGVDINVEFIGLANIFVVSLFLFHPILFTFIINFRFWRFLQFVLDQNNFLKNYS